LEEKTVHVCKKRSRWKDLTLLAKTCGKKILKNKNKMKKPNEDEKASGSDKAVIKREDRKIVLIQTLNSSCFFLKNSCWASDSSSSTHSMKSGVSGCTKEFITLFSVYGSGSSISSESGSGSRVLMTGNWRKKMKLFFDQKLQFTYVYATEKDFSSQKRTSSTSKNEIY
jgi:hypothetical protein